MATAKIVIGYKTALVAEDVLAALMPKFAAPRNYTDQKKIDEFIANKKEQFLEAALLSPHTATLSEVFIVDRQNEQVKQFVADGKKAKSVALRTAAYLTTAYPDAWAADIGEARNTQAVFLGFKPRLFLKLLGIECSLSGSGKPLPPGLWFGNADHRDIGEAILADSSCDLAAVVQYRQPADGSWKAHLDGWEGPGVSPEKDASLTVELAAQLGFFVLEG